MENLENQKINEWTILIDNIKIGRYKFVWAICSCGKYRLINRNPISISCGHIRKPKPFYLPPEFMGYYSNHSLEECVIKFNRDKGTIWKWAKSLGLSKIRSDIKLLPNYLSDKQMDIVIGGMLGDACLRKVNTTKSNSNFRVSHGEPQLNYLEWTQKELMPYSGGIMKTQASESMLESLAILDNKLPDLDVIRFNYSFETVRKPIFTEMEKKWYLRDESGNYILDKNNRRIKIIPRDLELNPLRLAVWFYDDGVNSPKKRTAYFCTNSFPIKECEFLVKQLEKLGIKSKVIKINKRGNMQNMIRILSESYLNFINIIKNEIHCECMNYKISLINYKEPNFSSRFQKGSNKIIKAS